MEKSLVQKKFLDRTLVALQRRLVFGAHCVRRSAAREASLTKQRAAKPKSVEKRHRYLKAAKQIVGILSWQESDTWRSPFDADVLGIYRELGKQLVQHARQLAANKLIKRVDVAPAVLDEVFATGRPDHAFRLEPLRWGFGLTEPMATKTLARLLSAGSGEVRARRISAFLQAVGIPEDRDRIAALEHCRISAEQDRIDLKLVWKDDADRDTVVIVEAKFGHKVTKGQLSGYRKAVSVMHKAPPFASILLTLDDGVLSDLHEKQRKIWKQVDWRVFWLRFERLRPIEHDADLQMFLNTLWHRSGCLTKENRHGWI